MEFYEAYLSRLVSHFPETAAKIDLRQRISSNLTSPNLLTLKSSLREQAKEIVRAFDEIRELRPRSQALEAISPVVIDPKNYSVLMSFDFHVDENDQLKLIEINTNASSSLIVDNSYGVRGLPNGFTASFPETIMSSFEVEHSLCRPGEKLQHVAIIDEKPEEQRLYAEFELFAELFRKRGYKVSIADPSELKFDNGRLRTNASEAIDLVYNRHTDFYLEEPQNAHLKRAFEERSTCFSPNPHEYRLLADKDRLLELAQPGGVESLAISEKAKNSVRGCLLETREVKSFEPQELWAQRKQWFFKPRRSFGGKAVYRGDAVRRSAFELILKEDFVVQKYVPPQTVLVSEDLEFKTDLRFYSYRGEIQSACARLYRGQTTNAQTPGGGITPIAWID